MAQILSGKNAIREILKANRREILQIYFQSKNFNDPVLLSLCEKKGYRLKAMDKEELHRLTHGPHHQGIAAKVSDFPYSEFGEIVSQKNEKSLVLVCDSIQDPQNLGAICRSAHCFGVQALFIPKDRSVDVTPAVVQASAGAVEHLQMVKVTNVTRLLEALKENDYWTYATDTKGEESLENIKPALKTAIVLGSEGDGIRPLVLKTCDVRFRIPFVNEFDSLNVAQAAGIVLYEVAKKYV